MVSAALLAALWYSSMLPMHGVMHNHMARVRTYSQALVMRGASPKKISSKTSRRKKSRPLASRPNPRQPSSGDASAHSKDQSREEHAREAHMELVRAAVVSRAPSLIDALALDGFAVCDDFLPMDTISVMRGEAESLRQGEKMVASQSSRWNEERGEVERYEKRNVLSTNLRGGEDYHLAPRLTEYCVSLVATLPSLINARFTHAALDDRLHTNKLAVCLGDGSCVAALTPCHNPHSPRSPCTQLVGVLPLRATHLLI